MRGVIVCLTLAACSGPSWAGNCRSYQSYQPAYVEPVVYERTVIVAQYLPLIVAAPTYSIGYDPNYVALQRQTVAAAVAPAAPYADHVQQPAALAPVQQPCEVQLKACNDRLAALERQLAAMQQPANGPGRLEQVQPPQAVQPGPSTRLQVFSKSCIHCHEAKVAKDLGHGLTLVANGAEAPLTPAQELAVIQKMYSGEMPKKPAGWTDEKFETIRPTDADFAGILAGKPKK